MDASEEALNRGDREGTTSQYDLAGGNDADQAQQAQGELKNKLLTAARRSDSELPSISEEAGEADVSGEDGEGDGEEEGSGTGLEVKGGRRRRHRAGSAQRAKVSAENLLD